MKQARAAVKSANLAAMSDAGRRDARQPLLTLLTHGQHVIPARTAAERLAIAQKRAPLAEQPEHAMCCRPPLLSCRRRLNTTISRSRSSSSSSSRRRQHRRHPLCRPQCRRFRASRRGRIVRRPSIDRPRGRHQSISCTLLHSPSSTHPPYNSAHTSNPASASVTLTPTLNLSLLHHSPSTTHPHRSTPHATFTTHPRHSPS